MVGLGGGADILDASVLSSSLLLHTKDEDAILHHHPQKSSRITGKTSFSRLKTTQKLASKSESLIEGPNQLLYVSLEERISSLERGRLDPDFPSVERFISILHDCKKVKDNKFIMRCYMYLQSNGLESQPLPGNLFISIFADVGNIYYAQKVFNRLHCRNECSWMSLILGYVKCGEPQEALIFYKQMQQDDSVYPSKHTFVAALKACSQITDLECGCRIHDQIAKKGLIERDVVVGSALVHMYAQCGVLTKAQAVFDNLLVRDRISWNALLTGYAKHGHNVDALNCFEEMRVEGIAPDPVTLLCCLKACGSIGALDRGELLHAEIDEKGFLETNVTIGNALVDMYAKCGSLIKAQEVFDKLPIRDVVSWTALISGYVEAGNGHEALNCFDHMQDDGVSSDPILFVCALKACGCKEEVSKGQDLHIEIVIKGFDQNMHVCSSLVDMYAKFGYLSTSKKLLDSLSIRDLVSWNALITGYVKFGYVDEALTCFDQMQHEAIPPDAITYACSLTACGLTGAADKGQEIHDMIVKQGCLLERDPSVVNALIDMYAKCGLLTVAHNVFDSLVYRDVVLWTILISGYAENGYCEEALNCFSEMQFEGISPDALTFVCCLKACGSIGATDMGEEIHAEIARQGLLEQDTVLGNALLDMYVKCGMLAKASDFFNELPVRDVVTWNVLIGGYIQHQSCKEALVVFHQMQQEGIFTDHITYTCILKACGSLVSIEKGQEIHSEIMKKGFAEKDEVGNALIDMYCKCSYFTEAESTLENLSIKSLVSWNALISGYADHDHAEEAIKCFSRMQVEGFHPNAVTYVSIVKSCNNIGAIDKGKELHLEIAKKGLLEADCLLGGSLLDMYAKYGMLEKAQKVFDGLAFHDVVSWTSLIAGYAEHGFGEAALTCFEKMQHESIPRDAITFIYILKACSSLGAINKGEEICVEIFEAGLVEKDIDVGNALLDMYAKCGSPAKAMEVFEKLSDRDIVSWTTLATAYALVGESKMTFSIVDKMMKQGEDPNLITFLCLLNVCSHTGLVSKALMYFKVMCEDFCFVPSVEHHGCIIDLLGRAGQLEVAMALVKRMPFNYTSSDVWHTLLNACRKCGNVELGEQVFEHALVLDQGDTAAYVCMSNLYLECYNWETNNMTKLS